MSAPNNSLAAAIAKAKEVAAKLSQQIPNSESGKRSADSDGDQSSKKFASITDVVGAGLAQIKAQTTSNSIVEEYKVPDKLVGLVIGKGGEQIQKLQAEAGCKVVVQTESIGLPYRICTLTGERSAIERAKRLIDDIIQRGATDSSMLPAGQQVFELRIPGNKCGLIIGKNGETIKRLGEQYGVKLVVVQETNSASNSDKPLRITGESERVQRCKEAVLQLIEPKNEQPGANQNKYQTNEYGSKSSSYRPGIQANGQCDSYIKVPSDKAGIVIGKGGETIKDINRRSGALCEIDKAYKNTDGPDKYFIIRGSQDQILYCQQLIYEKITGNVGSQPPTGYFGPNALQGTASSPNDSYNSVAAAAAWGGYDPSPNSNGAASMDTYNAVAWAAYYHQYYQQQAQQTPTTPSQQSSTQGASTATAAGGQQDYSLAWVEYYRSLGMNAEADAILKQAANNGNNTPSSTATTTSTTPTTTATNTSTATLQAQAQAWQSSYGYAGYPNPGYSAQQTQ